MSVEEQKVAATVVSYNEKLEYLKIMLDDIRTSKPGPMTYKDYNLVDEINLTESEGYKYFLRKYCPGKNVLEIGAGLGGPGRMMVEEFGINLVGIDYNAENVAFGNEISRELNMIEFLRGGDARTPLSVQGIPDNSVDAVILFGVVSAVPQNLHMTIYEHAARAVRPGGFILLEDFCTFCPVLEFPPRLRNILIREFAYFAESPMFNTTRS
jgi:SAM-dependent methyltransferase